MQYVVSTFIVKPHAYMNKIFEGVWAFWKIVEKLCWLSYPDPGVQKNNIFYNKPTFDDNDGTNQKLERTICK